MKSIILTGPKASGKTSAGKTLASLCKREFIDLDELIFQRTGKTPRQLYIDGSPVFQKAEADAVKSLASNELSRIISAGGGIIDNPEAFGLLKKIDTAKIVYINVSSGSAWGRISASARKTGELPPFLQTENPQETHRVLHERRAAAYSQSTDLTVDADGKTPDEIALKIIEHYKLL